MGGFLRYTSLPTSHLRVSISIPSNVFPSKYFVPYSRSRKTAVGIVKMITVPAQRVAESSFPCALYRLSARHQEQLTIGRLTIDDLLHVARAGLNRIPHLLLVGMVARKSRVLGILAVRPGLHPTELCIRLVSAYGIDKQREPRLI